MDAGIVKSLTDRMRQLVDLIFGYDFFISYAHADGMQYPCVLADMLKRMGYTVFLDTEGYQAGTDLRIATRRRIRMSRKLIVIARQQALGSGWVKREVQTCLDAQRTPVVVDVNRILEDADPDLPVKVMLEDRLYIRETLPTADAEPSTQVVQKLHESYTATRREVVRLRLVSGVCVVLVVAAGIAINQSRIAELRRQEADDQRAIAEAQKARADQERAEAVRQRDAAVSRLLVLDARELRATRPASALLVAAAAARRESSFQTRALLLNTLLQTPNLERFLHGDGEPWTVVRLAEDGSAQITADASNRLRLWARESGRLVLSELGEMSFQVSSLAFSKDASLAAVGGVGGDMLVVSTKTGEVVRTWPKAHRQRVAGLAFNADARRLASGAEATELYLWDLESGERLAQLAQHKSAPEALAFDPTGRWLASAGQDGRVLLWDVGPDSVGDGSIAPTVLPHEGSGFVHALAFSRGGKMLAGAGESKAVMLWELDADPAPPTTLDDHEATVRALAFKPDGEELISASEDGQIIVWSPVQQTYGRSVVLRNPPGSGVPTTVAFAEGSRAKLISSGPGRFALQWAQTGHAPIARPLRDHRGLVFDATLTTAASVECSVPGGPTKPCRRWAIQRWRLDPLERIGAPVEVGAKRPRKIVFAGGSTQVLALSSDRTLKLWDLEQGVAVRDYPAPRRPEPKQRAPNSDKTARPVAEAVHVSAAAAPLLAVGETLRGLCGTHNAGLDAIAFTANADAMVIGGTNGCVALWQAASGWSDEPIVRRPGPVVSLALSGAGERLATGGPAGELSIWDTTTRSLIGEYPLGARKALELIAFDAGGTRLAVAGLETVPPAVSGYIVFPERHGFLVLWDVDAKRALEPWPPGYSTEIESLAFNADGTLAVTGRCGSVSGSRWSCPEGSIQLWDVNAGLQLGPTIKAHRGTVSRLTLSDDGRVLASYSTGAGGDILLWQLDTRSWIRAACEMANRDFTKQEEKRYFADIYGSPCGDQADDGSMRNMAIP